MSIAKSLAVRAITLIGVLFTVLFIVAITLGATGFSERMLTAIVNEEVRGLRQQLVQNIRDSEEIERVITERKEFLEESYGLDRPWYQRLPQTIGKVIILDLGEARTLKTSEGSRKVIDLILERLPRTMLLMTTATIITALIGLTVGVKLATKVGTKVDRAVSILSATSNALPAWWAGIMLILLTYVILNNFGVRLFPPGGMYSTPPLEGTMARTLDLIWHALLPIITMILISAGSWIYVIRTMVMNTAQEEFVNLENYKYSDY